jgi:hypothetical protein
MALGALRGSLLPVTAAVPPASADDPFRAHSPMSDSPRRLLASGHARADFSQDFQTDTSGWFPGTDSGTDTVNREPDGYVSPDYASGINSASPTEHARLRRGLVPAVVVVEPPMVTPGDCGPDNSGAIVPSVLCTGPFTRWGGYNFTWQGGYTTQVDVYLDVDYALANPDSINGNSCLITNPGATSCNGTRFDYTPAINGANDQFVEDFAFHVGTGNPTLFTPCPPPGGFVVTASDKSRPERNQHLRSKPRSLPHREIGLVHLQAYV